MSAWLRALLQLALGAYGLQLLHDRIRVLLGNVLLEHGRRVLDSGLGLRARGPKGGLPARQRRRGAAAAAHLLEAEAGEGADLLDNLDLGARVKLGKLDGELRLLLRGAGVLARASSSSAGCGCSARSERHRAGKMAASGPVGRDQGAGMVDAPMGTPTEALGSIPSRSCGAERGQWAEDRVRCG